MRDIIDFGSKQPRLTRLCGANVSTRSIDWKYLETNVQKCITLGASESKRTFLLKTIGDEKIRLTEWASLISIAGETEFFSGVNHQVKSSRDLGLLVKYLEAHVGYLFGEQAAWVNQQIESLQAYIAGGQGGSPDRTTRDVAIEEESRIESGNADPVAVHPLRMAIRMAIEELASLAGMSEKLAKAFGTTRTADEAFLLDEVVDRLLMGTEQPDRGFPLQRLSSAMKRWARQAEPIPGADRKHFVYLKDLLMVASFPDQDHHCVEEAMRCVLAETPLGGKPIYCGTGRREAVERLLRATMARLMPEDFPNSAIPKLLQSCGSGTAAHDMDKRLSLMFQRLKVIPDPDVKPADRSTEDYYAEMGVLALSKEPLNVANWSVQFNYILERHYDDQEVVAMFLSEDRETAIEVLKERFPRLLLVPLPEQDLERYAQIYYEVGVVNEALEVLCGAKS